MSEELIIRHCSPTLAGMKTGNMFTCSFHDHLELRQQIRNMNQILVKKGLRVLPLRVRGNKVLIYVYRPAHLYRDLKNDVANRLLKERGYNCEVPAGCITHLIRRLKETKEFPHEIGLFLGYPPEDVLGFIEEKTNSKMVGYWRVYGDMQAAEKLFAKYKKCTAVYCEKHKAGRPMELLTVAV